MTCPPYPSYLNWCPFEPRFPPRSLVWLRVPAGFAAPIFVFFPAACLFSFARTRSGSLPMSARDRVEKADDLATDRAPSPARPRLFETTMNGSPALPPTKAPLEAPAEAVYDFRAANAGGCCVVM